MKLRRDGKPHFHVKAEDLEQLSAERGISLETLRLAKIHVTDDGWWGIPYLNLTGVWYVRKRNPDPDGKPKYLSPKKAQPHLYNPLGLGPNAAEVWFAEGEFDTLALVDAGVPAVGYPGVKTILEYNDDAERDEAQQRTANFKAAWRLLYSEAFVVAAGDMDSEGKKAIRSVVRAFSPNSAHFQVPEGADLNDWWRSDPDGMAKAIEEFRREL